MALLSRKKTRYDRYRIMQDAARARERGKSKKALSLYQRVLEFEPENAELHRKVAPLLAQTKQQSQARSSYLRAVSALVRDGFSEQATGLYREALHFMPRDVELWAALAELQLKRDQRADAIETLLQGRHRFRRRDDRPHAIRLLLRAQEIQPYHFKATFDLAGLLAKSPGGGRRAFDLLEGLAARTRGGLLRRVRGRQFRLAPGLRSAGHWLRAVFRGR
jgi:tetratricopeptide (TPR) repeat protein